MCLTQEIVAGIMTKALDHDLHRQTAWRMMGHLLEMANPQHAKKLMSTMSTPKLISKLVTQQIKASEPNNLKAIPPHRKLPDKVIEPAVTPSNFQHANPAAQAIDYKPRNNSNYKPRGNISSEEADIAFMAYFSEDVETEDAISQYWRD